jgi:GH15 family glucan-1,4-alpha-glucosidase
MPTDAGSDEPQPIDGYAILGDGRSCVLIGRDGSVGWWALPRMDSAPAFGALLSPDRGGRLSLRPTGHFEVSRSYVDGGAVLRTEFRTPTGRVRVTDSLNLGSGSLLPWTELARRVEALDGEVPMSWEVAPGDRFATAAPWAHRCGQVPLIVAGDQNLALVLDGVGDAERVVGGFRGRFVAEPGEPALLAVVATDGAPHPVPAVDAVARRIDETIAHWARWGTLVEYDGPWQDAVVRGAYVQKQLTSAASGAVQAAATTSLPEKVGGEKNFDYRFCWVRDTGYALTALSHLGLRGEVHAALTFLVRAVGATAPVVRPLYAMDGTTAPAEIHKVPLWRGYRGSSPVQSGNSAATQKQLGSYGDLLEAIGTYAQHGNVLDGRTARLVVDVADQVCRQWTQDDAGFWELGQQRPYTSSKLGCWAALDQSVKLVEAGQVPGHREEKWKAVAADIQDYVRTACWSPARGAFTFYAGTDELDCAALLTARTGFCAGDDPQLHGTIDAVRSELSAGGPLLYRYSGMRGAEGAFVACSFWLVEALSITGRLDEARQVMDDLVGMANDVGLLSEQIDPESGELLGNVPQTLSHLALINAATTYRRMLLPAEGAQSKKA